MTAFFLVSSKLSRCLPGVPFLERNPSILVTEKEEHSNDNSYTKIISKIRFGNTSKTTSTGRHFESNEFLFNKFLGKCPAILDVGASDGSTSIDLINKLDGNYSKYYITDYHLWAAYTIFRGHLYIFDLTTNECVLISNKIYAVRPNVSKLIYKCFKSQIQKLKEGVQEFDRTLLLHPKVKHAIKKNSLISVFQFSVFDEWVHQRVDLIKVANVLNRVYFSDEKIISAIVNMRRVLKEDGILAVVHNTNRETASFYRKFGDELLLVEKLNGGVAIDDLITLSNQKSQ